MKSIIEFFKDEDGSLTVGLSLIFPILICFVILSNQKWQAHYIRMETQAILDFATLGAAETGEATEVKGKKSCTIPYKPSDTTYSGNHVAKYLIKENMHNLPKSLQDQLTSLMQGNKMEGIGDWTLQQQGYMNLGVHLKYRVPLQLFYSHYNFNIKSTARCQPE